jgi:hypothetical protein
MSEADGAVVVVVPGAASLIPVVMKIPAKAFGRQFRDRSTYTCREETCQLTLKQKRNNQQYIPHTMASVGT